jgi:hypothetical protein
VVPVPAWESIAAKVRAAEEPKAAYDTASGAEGPKPVRSCEGVSYEPGPTNALAGTLMMPA